MEKNGNGKLIGALVIGAAVGATLGVLFAPDKGSETRKKLMAKGRDLKNKATDLMDQATTKSDKSKTTY